MLKEILLKVFEDTRTRSFWVVNIFSGGVIITSLFLILLESDPYLYDKFQDIFVFLEYAITAIFTVEYFIYIYLSKKKLSYIFSFYGVIDLLSILPTYLFFAELHFLQVLRVARLVRLFRLLRLLKIIRMVHYQRRKEKAEWQILKLNLLVYFAAYVILTSVFSVILFHIEQGVPDTQIKTIQDAVWSTISALTSVGFGDTFPVSFPGRLFLGFVMIMGVGFLSFAILVMGRMIQQLLFGEEVERELFELKESHTKFRRSHRRFLKKEGERTVD